MSTKIFVDRLGPVLPRLNLTGNVTERKRAATNRSPLLQLTTYNSLLTTHYSQLSFSAGPLQHCRLGSFFRHLLHMHRAKRMPQYLGLHLLDGTSRNHGD